MKEAASDLVTDAWFMHPMCPERRRRLRQVFRYLQAHWTATKRTRLVVRRIADKHDETASTMAAQDGALVITIDARACYSHAADLLLHEWAHAVTWTVRGSDHGPAWAGVYAAIATAFWDGDALEESLDW